MINKIINTRSFYKVLYVTTLSLTLAMGLMLFGCEEKPEESFTHEPWDYQVKTMEAEFNGEVVLDTTTMDDEEETDVLDDVNGHLDEVELIVDADIGEELIGGHWVITFTTVENRTLVLSPSYDKLSEDKIGIPVTLDGERVGHLGEVDYVGLLEAFDADSYIPER